MSNDLQQAIAAIKAGDDETGQQLLAQAINADPQNEVAWLLMADIVESTDHRRECLERVLKLNPSSEQAKQGLLELERESGLLSAIQATASWASQQSDVGGHGESGRTNHQEPPRSMRPELAELSPSGAPVPMVASITDGRAQQPPIRQQRIGIGKLMLLGISVVLVFTVLAVLLFRYSRYLGAVPSAPAVTATLPPPKPALSDAERRYIQSVREDMGWRESWLDSILTDLTDFENDPTLSVNAAWTATLDAKADRLWDNSIMGGDAPSARFAKVHESVSYTVVVYQMCAGNVQLFAKEPTLFHFKYALEESERAAVFSQVVLYELEHLETTGRMPTYSD